jgi:hypothetical protein
MTIQAIETRRDAILAEMRAIRSMAKGSVSEQFYQVVLEGKKEPVQRGPYFVFCRSVENRTVSRRLRSPEEVARARRDVEAYQKFAALNREFVELTERLGELERVSADEERKKKRPRSRSRRTGKS